MKTWQVLALARRDGSAGAEPTDQSGHPRLEDLERLAFDKISAKERARIEPHIQQCSACRQILEEASGVAEQLAQLAAPPPDHERRQAVRYKLNEQATLAVCNPPEFSTIRGEIVNASITGLLIRIPRNLHRGEQVYILVENAAVFGTVRYCRDNADQSHDAGIAIDQVVMRPGLSADLDSEARVPANGHSSAASHRLEILCVEDNPGDVRIMEMILDEIQIPHHMSVARDGAQALQRLFDTAAPKPDLVVLDLNLPKINGFEFLERVRRHQTLRILPVVILSSSTARADLDRAAALGVKAYLQKPDDLEHQSELRCRMELLMTQLAEVSS